jgi:hypothetical protein
MAESQGHRAILEHDLEKVETGFPKRSFSNKKITPESDSTPVESDSGADRAAAKRLPRAFPWLF